MLSTLVIVTMLSAELEPHPAIEPRLTKITDHRVSKLTEDESGFDFNQPEFSLTFDLDLRPGFEFSAFDQTGALITATDSVGADLSAIEANMFGRQDHFEAIGVWSEDRFRYDSFKLRLVQPARSAEHFSVNASVPVTVYAGTEVHEIRLDGQSRELSAATFGPGASIGMAGQDENTDVSIRPGTLKETIEDLQLVVDGAVIDSMSTFWNDDVATYKFAAPLPEQVTIRIVTRSNMHVVPLRIKIEKMPLP